MGGFSIAMLVYQRVWWGYDEDGNFIMFWIWYDNGQHTKSSGKSSVDGQINYFDWAMFNSKVSKITSNYQRVTMKPWQFPNSQHLPHLPPSFWGSQGPLYDSLKLTSQRHDNAATGRPKWFFGPTKYHLNPWNHLWLLMVHENTSCNYLYTYIYIFFFNVSPFKTDEGP
jgi:hypothetical protein